MPNFRKAIDPNYKATRKHPTTAFTVRIEWEHTEMGAAAAIVDNGTGWDMYVFSVVTESREHAGLVPHVVTAGLYSLAAQLGYKVVSCKERIPATEETDLDRQGF